MKLMKFIPAILMSAVMMTSCAYSNYEPEYADTGSYESTSASSAIEETESYNETNTAEAESSATESYPSEAGITESDISEISVEKNGSYTSPEDVAEYIHSFGTLPQNFITKSEAQKLGWDSSLGNLWEVAEGKSIGGDRFGNYEKLLPEADGRTYKECDVNYEGGYRGSERIIFSNDGLIFYTDDHYESFTQLY